MEAVLCNQIVRPVISAWRIPDGEMKEEKVERAWGYYVADTHFFFKSFVDNEAVGGGNLMGTVWEDLWFIFGSSQGFWLSDNEQGESQSLHSSHTQWYHGGFDQFYISLLIYCILSGL